MKRIPKLPYIHNLVAEYARLCNNVWVSKNYVPWLRTHGFSVPIRGDYLEFPDTFSDEDLMKFILKYS